MILLLGQVLEGDLTLFLTALEEDLPWAELRSAFLGVPHE